MKQIIEYITSFVTIALVFAGIGGFFYNLFKEGGWLGSGVSKFVDLQLENPVIAIPLTIGAIIVGKMWRDHQVAKGKTSRLPDLFIYVIMAGGAYFIYRFVTTGSF